MFGHKKAHIFHQQMKISLYLTVKFFKKIISICHQMINKICIFLTRVLKILSNIKYLFLKASEINSQTTTGIRTVNIPHLHVRYTSCLLVSTNMMDYNVFEMIYDRYWQLCLLTIHIIVYDIRYTACKFPIFLFRLGHLHSWSELYIRITRKGENREIGS